MKFFFIDKYICHTFSCTTFKCTLGKKLHCLPTLTLQTTPFKYYKEKSCICVEKYWLQDYYAVTLEYTWFVLYAYLNRDGKGNYKSFNVDCSTEMFWKYSRQRRKSMQKWNQYWKRKLLDILCGYKWIEGLLETGRKQARSVSAVIG